MPLGEITEAHFDKTFDINVKGTLFTVQKALPLLREGASIMLNGSIVDRRASRVRSVYSATQGGAAVVRADVDGRPQERKIRVNVVSPGPVDTPGVQEPQ